jgi:hypothetical protein
MKRRGFLTSIGALFGAGSTVKALSANRSNNLPLPSGDPAFFSLSLLERASRPVGPPPYGTRTHSYFCAGVDVAETGGVGGTVASLVVRAGMRVICMRSWNDIKAAYEEIPFILQSYTTLGTYSGQPVKCISVNGTALGWYFYQGLRDAFPDADVESICYASAPRHPWGVAFANIKSQGYWFLREIMKESAGFCGVADVRALSQLSRVRQVRRLRDPFGKILIDDRNLDSLPLQARALMLSFVCIAGNIDYTGFPELSSEGCHSVFAGSGLGSGRARIGRPVLRCTSAITSSRRCLGRIPGSWRYSA